MTQIVLPEQLTLELVPASYGSRGLAYSIDFFIRWTLALLAFVTIFIAASQIEQFLIWSAEASEYFDFLKGIDQITAFLIAMILGIAFLVQWSYCLYFDLVHGGVTPGKRIVGLRTVTVQGLLLTWRESLLRTIFLIVDILPLFGMVGMVAMLLSRERQRLGDIVAGTLVIYDTDKKPKTVAASAEFQIPAEIFELASEWNSRRESLDARHRNHIASELVRLFTPYVDQTKLPQLPHDDARALWIFERSIPRDRR